MLVAYFAYVDVYNVHFFDAGYSRSYNALRLVFALYLFWIIYFSGSALLAILCKETSDITPAERIALGFFAGAPLWTLVMMPLGYLGLYTRTTAVLITAPLVAASAPHFLQTARNAANALRGLRLGDGLHVIAATAALAAAALLLIVKGLYPSGGHDYFTHYFYYFLAVVDHHNIWPNEVWYHYYYSKSMGLFFLGMLLTDPLAHSLATFCFVIAAAIALFALLDRLNPGTLWPWTAVILYLAFYVYTRGTGTYLANGGWGDFQKDHETSSAFIVALLWIGVRLVSAADSDRRQWWIAGALCAYVMAFVASVSALVIGLFFCILSAAYLARRQWEKGLSFFWLAATAGVGLISVLVLNYVTTGVPLDNGLEWFWPIVDLKRVEEWGVLPEVVLVAAGRVSIAQNPLPIIGEDMREFVENVFRADILWTLYKTTAGALVIWGAYGALRTLLMRRGNRIALHLQRPSAPLFVALIALLVSMLCALMVTGRTQPISFARYTSFMLPLMIAVSIAVWQVMTASMTRGPRTRWIFGLVLPVVLLVITFDGTGNAYRSSLARSAADAGRFVTGSFSIYDAYVNQTGWPARGPDGAVRPWALAVWKLLGPGTRFWTFSVHTYCMLPGCRPEAILLFRMSPRSLNILLGEPTEARAIFQQEKLNYFLLEMEDNFRDLLPCSALFSPDRIGAYLGTKWTDGTHFLLTWLGPGIEHLTPSWLEDYRKKAGAAPCAQAPSANSGPAAQQQSEVGGGLDHAVDSTLRSQRLCADARFARLPGAPTAVKRGGNGCGGPDQH